MSVSVNLQRAVTEKNIDDIRGCLWSCIAVDPNLSGKFKDSLDYVLDNGVSESELFESDDGEDFDTEPTQENFTKLGGMIRSNFSKKKVNALGIIGKILYPPKDTTSEDSKNYSSNTRSRPQQAPQQFNPTTTIGGAAIGAIAGAIIGKLAIGGAVAIVGGTFIGAAIGTAIGAIAGTETGKKN